MTDHEPGVKGGQQPEPGAALPGLPDQAGKLPAGPGPAGGKQRGLTGSAKQASIPGPPGHGTLPPMPAPPKLPGQPAAPGLPGPAAPASLPGAPSPSVPAAPSGPDGAPGPDSAPALPSLHDQPAPLAATAPVSRAGTGAPLRPVPDAGPPAAPHGAGPGGPAAGAPGGDPARADLERLASMVSERMAAGRAGAHADPPPQMPSVEEAVLLREKAPELYDLWLKIAQDRATTDNYVHRAPYEVPERLAHSGRPRALSAMVVVLAFGGYLASLGGPGPYIGGVIAILDLLIMLALFFGLRPEHLSEPGRPRKRRLTRRRAAAARAGTWPPSGLARPPQTTAPRALPRPGCCQAGPATAGWPALLPIRHSSRWPAGCSAPG